MLVKVFGRKPEKGAGIFFIPILAGWPPGAVRRIIEAHFLSGSAAGTTILYQFLPTGNRLGLSFGTTDG